MGTENTEKLNIEKFFENFISKSKTTFVLF